MLENFCYYCGGLQLKINKFHKYYESNGMDSGFFLNAHVVCRWKYKRIPDLISVIALLITIICLFAILGNKTNLSFMYPVCLFVLSFISGLVSLHYHYPFPRKSEGKQW